MHEAYFGIVKAAAQYDPDQGALFLSYAAHWIKQAVKHYLDNSGQELKYAMNMGWILVDEK
jgi:DNA-directed RNA polymerase sigma subunit (sigma70/sigma32)